MILTLFRDAPEQVVASYDTRMSYLLRLLTTGFMGPQWTKRHVFTQPFGSISKKTKYGLFELEYSNDIARETKIQRLTDLTEMLFNLQTEAGFFEFYDRFREKPAREFEAAYAELQTARMLYATGYRFRFVEPKSLKKGENYDFEIRYPDGLIACLETKSRMEAETVNPDAVAGKLRKARTQLPENAPGIILFKIPQHWYTNPDIQGELRSVALDFLRSTTRVVSVKYYVSRVDLDTRRRTTTHRHAYDEITNLQTKFPVRNWNIFHGNEHPTNWRFLHDIERGIANAKR